MSSGALDDLDERLNEVRILTGTDPARTGDHSRPRLSGAISRASIVLLSAHLEGYLEDIAVEALDVLVDNEAPIEKLPLILRAIHAEDHLVEIEPMKDRNARAVRIERLFLGESSLWINGGTLKSTMLRHATVCKEMSNPGSREVKRFLELVGLDLAVFLKNRGSDRLLGRIDGLVGKRNAIAHGEASVTTTFTDVDEYIALVDELAAEIDVGVAQSLQIICGSPTRPW